MRTKNPLPPGLSALRAFYLVNALLFIAVSLLFYDYLEIILFGSVCSRPWAIAVIIILTSYPLYLALRIAYLKNDFYAPAVFYHLFFIINGLSYIVYLTGKYVFIKPLIEITTKPEYKVAKVSDLFGPSLQSYLVQAAGITVGLAIIAFLLISRKKIR